MQSALSIGVYAEVDRGTTLNTNGYAYSVPSGSQQMALYGTSGYATLNCGKDLYGDEKLRRVISIPLRLANLN